MKLQEQRMIMVTGIMAAGKSTVAQELAGRYTKSVHLRGDVFRRMIVNGSIDMEPAPSEAAYKQLQLRYQLATQAAITYFVAGFTVIYQDIVIGPMLGEVVEMFKTSNPFPVVHLIVLCPSAEVVAEREAARSKTGYGTWTPTDLNRILQSETPRLGLWLDNSSLSVEETVDVILAQLEKAVV